MVMMLPFLATRKPAPALTFTSRTVILKPRGAPSLVWSSEKENWVLAMQMGILSKPSSVSCLTCFLASAVSTTPSAR